MGRKTINSKTKLGQKVAIKMQTKQNSKICSTDILAAMNLLDKISFLKIVSFITKY